MHLQIQNMRYELRDKKDKNLVQTGKDQSTVYFDKQMQTGHRNKAIVEGCIPLRFSSWSPIG